MSGTPFFSARWSQHLAYLLLLVGVAAYVYAWLYGRSLYLDEANLALVLETVSVPDLFLPLPFEQYAPPFFLTLAKAGLFVTGHQEWGLRLLPLLAALGSLWAMFRLLGQLNWSWNARLVVLSWMALSPHLTRYASECKQYSWDVLITILLLSVAVHYRQHPPKQWSWSGPALLFLIIPWASMPAVFLLGTWGGLEILGTYRQRDYKNSIAWLGVSLLGLCSFLLYYQQVIGDNLTNTLLLDYHRPWFMPWRLDQPGQLSHAFSLLTDLGAWSYGHTAISLVAGIALGLIGWVVLLKKQPFSALLLTGPLVLAIGASMAGHFTLIPRVNLFMIPLLLLLSGSGIQWLAGRWKEGIRPWIMLLVWALCLSSFLGKLPKLWQEPEIENLYQVMHELSDRSDQTPWYIHWNAMPAFRYYTEFHAERSRYGTVKTTPLPWTTSESILSEMDPPPAFWLVYSHLISDQARQEQEQFSETLNTQYDAVDTITAHGAMAIRYEQRLEDRN